MKNPRMILSGQACRDCGFCAETRDARIAGLALEGALDGWPPPSAAVAAACICAGDFLGSQRQLRKAKKREERQLRRAARDHAVAAIRAAPEAYGFSGLELLVIGWLVSGIVSAIVRWLLEKRWSGGDKDLQWAASSLPTTQGA